MFEIGRFASVGLLATLVHVCAAFSAKAGLGVAPQAANLFGFCASVLISYFGHRSFTFRVASNHAVHFPRFVTLALLGLLVSSTTTYFVTTYFGLPFAYAMGLVALLVPAATFVGAKFWAFAEAAKPRPVALSGLGVAVCLSALFLAVMWGRTINHDTAWYLHATRDWLNGARLYVDIVEVNPPWNFYLTIPVIWVSDLLSLSPVNAQYLVLAGLLAMSLSWIWVLLQSHGRLSHLRQLWVLAGAALALTVPAASGVAQREHIMVLLIAPYVFGYLLLDRPDGGIGGVARALVAAIGLCIKPHFMLFPVALTFVRVLQARSFAPIWSLSNVTIVTVGALYVVMVRAVHPEYLDTIVPMALLVYGDYGLGSSLVMERAEHAIFFFLCYVIGVGYWLHGLPKGTGFILALVIAALLIYISQWTGYRYQAFPIKAFITLFAVWLLAHTPLKSIPAISAVTLLGLLALDAVRVGFYPQLPTPVFREAVREAGPNPGVMVFSTSLQPAFPLVVEENARWTSRYPTFWLVPGALRGTRETNCEAEPYLCDEYAAILHETRRAIVADFVSGAPDVLIFDKRHRYIAQEDFDFRKFLSPQAGFSESFEGYELAETYGAFEIWKKK